MGQSHKTLVQAGKYRLGLVRLCSREQYYGRLLLSNVGHNGDLCQEAWTSRNFEHEGQAATDINSEIKWVICSRKSRDIQKEAFETRIIACHSTTRCLQGSLDLKPILNNDSNEGRLATTFPQASTMIRPVLCQQRTSFPAENSHKLRQACWTNRTHEGNLASQSCPIQWTSSCLASGNIGLFSEI